MHKNALHFILQAYNLDQIWNRTFTVNTRHKEIMFIVSHMA